MKGPCAPASRPAVTSNANTPMQGFDATQGVVLNDTAQHLVNDILVWIGFGTVIGLLAKGIMPGRDPGGAIATVLMGIGGTVMGCGVLRYFNHAAPPRPATPLAT